MLDTGDARKTDLHDAASVAHVAQCSRKLRTDVAETDHAAADTSPTPRRLAHERVRITNRLHGLLQDPVPAGAALGLSATLLRSVRPTIAADACRRDLARDLIDDLHRTDRLLKSNEKQTGHAVPVAAAASPRSTAWAPYWAARSSATSAMLRAFHRPLRQLHRTSPLDASSGERRRHRLNAGGNRQLNSAPHTIAVCQARGLGSGADYYQRKLTEGKTRRSAPSPSNGDLPTSSTATPSRINSG
ncbi:hypothetical protein [Catellatospora sp. NPDC049609]|uniref:hypothetical protein n=1 Tax=Catellatospora sp. NPDC049609 TaxID=3155505 RepID=UPI00341A1A86